MTLAEMHIQFKVGLDKTDSLNYPNFEPEEIDLWLNRSQDRFVKQRYTHDPKSETFEETQKRTDDLRTIVTEITLPPSATQIPIKPNGILFDLPNGIIGGPTIYWFAINEECEIRYMDCNGSWVDERVGVYALQHNDYNKVIDDPFNKPSQGVVLRLMHGTWAELLTDGSFTINSYFLRYLREPVRLDIINFPAVDCELADHTHEEIVVGAVTLALENIASPRFQSHIMAEMTQE
tara:strand:- start:23235 stop:23939 length:705 start_codon:yes stop_codon:yes gene_type:complete